VVLFRHNIIANERTNYVQITDSHIPANREERNRIYKCGGEIRKLKNDFIDRVFIRGRLYPALHVTRSIGDEMAKIVGVTE